jgi:hypothetical protein
LVSLCPTMDDIVGQTFKSFGWILYTMVGHIGGRNKIKTGVTIDPELFEWIQEKIKTKEFSSITHAVERGLYLLRETMER